jgi:proline iminopeptidase
VAGRDHDWRLAGVTLHTTEIGPRRGNVRYALHGGPGLDHTYLRPWLDDLGRDTPLVYIDLRGHGRSSAPPDADGYSITAAADDLASLVVARGDGAVDVIAHDFGAAVAVALAQRHPEVVRRMVLVSPIRDAAQVRAVGRRSREALGDTGWRRIQSLTTAQGTLRDPRSLPELFKALGPMWWAQTPSDDVLRTMTRGMVYRADSDANFIQALLRWDSRMVASEVRAPTLVVAGAVDKTTLASESVSLASVLAHGTSRVIGRAGHLPFVEQRRLFNEVVTQFFTQH